MAHLAVEDVQVVDHHPTLTPELGDFDTRLPSEATSTTYGPENTVKTRRWSAKALRSRIAAVLKRPHEF